LKEQSQRSRSNLNRVLSNIKNINSKEEIAHGLRILKTKQERIMMLDVIINDRKELKENDYKG
jgi:hypothetical protein